MNEILFSELNHTLMSKNNFFAILYKKLEEEEKILRRSHKLSNQ